MRGGRRSGSGRACSSDCTRQNSVSVDVWLRIVLSELSCAICANWDECVAEIAREGRQNCVLCNLTCLVCACGEPLVPACFDAGALFALSCAILKANSSQHQMHKPSSFLVHRYRARTSTNRLIRLLAFESHESQSIAMFVEAIREQVRAFFVTPQRSRSTIKSKFR